MINKIYRCSTDVVLAGRVKFISGEDVLILGEVKDSFNIPCFIIQGKEKTFSTHQSFFLKYFYFLSRRDGLPKHIERIKQNEAK